MTPAKIRWLAAATALLALAVGGAVQHAGIQLSPKDQVSPPSLSLLGDGASIEIQRASRILLRADGKTFQEVSGERRLPVLLAQWGLALGEGDRLLLTGHTMSLDERLPDLPFLAVELRRAVRVTLEDSGDTTTFLSSATTLGEALAEQGVSLLVGDKLAPGAESLLDAPISASLQRGSSVTVRAGERRLSITTAAATVGEALAEAGLSLQGLDYSVPATDQPLPVDDPIRVVRVIETILLEQEIVLHETVWQVDPDAEVGESTVIQAGQDGVSSSRVRVRYEDGEEISLVEEGERLLVEPVTAINGYSSNFVIRTTVVDGVEIEYWATMDMYATSYSPCRSGVDECLYGTSTSGVSVAKGVAATYKDWLLAARGVTFYVSGYGPGAFYDVGGGFPDGRAWIDLGYSDDDWVGWSGWVTVYFTTPVPVVVPYFLYP